MESEIDLLRQENARLVAKITGLESEKAELLKQVAEEKAKHEAENAELRSKIEELERGRTDTTDAIAELKAEVVKLRDNNEQTFLQSEMLPEVTVISKEMVSGNEQKTTDELESQSSASSNTIILASNVYENAGVSDHREKKLRRKNEQGLIQEINSSMKEKHAPHLSAVTEISVNQVHPNNETSLERTAPDIISLYETACDAEKKAIEVNREETLRWCFYAREFKRMYKDFMISNKVGEKKAKGQVYDFIVKQLPDTKRKTLCRQTQKALRIDDLFEKICFYVLKLVHSYSADTISKFTNEEIQRIIDHFTEKPNLDFTDDPEEINSSNLDTNQINASVEERIPEVSSKNETPQIAPPKEDEVNISTHVDFEALFTELEEEIEKMVSREEKEEQNEISPSLPLICPIISPV